MNPVHFVTLGWRHFSKILLQKLFDPDYKFYSPELAGHVRVVGLELSPSCCLVTARLLAVF